jgi:hypothetical protein
MAFFLRPEDEVRGIFFLWSIADEAATATILSSALPAQPFLASCIKLE